MTDKPFPWLLLAMQGPKPILVKVKWKEFKDLFLSVSSKEIRDGKYIN